MQQAALVCPHSSYPLGLSAAGRWMQQWPQLCAAVAAGLCPWLPGADLQLGASGTWVSHLMLPESWPKGQPPESCVAPLDDKEQAVCFGVHACNLPVWVHFPDTKRVEWLSKTVKHMWPFIRQFIETLFGETIEPEFRDVRFTLKM